MTFLADLRKGTLGVRFTPIPTMVLVEDGQTDAVFRDLEHQVGWHITISPLMVDLSARHDQLLHEDLRIDSIEVFESTFYREVQAHDPSSRPRTADPTWSPIVSVEQITCGGAPAMVVIHRVTYAPGNELIAGRLVIPLERGTLYISAISRATTTGMRESVLAVLRPSSVEERLTQSQIDDPALDNKFPTHPLTLIRRALRTALTAPLHVTVVTPLGEDDGGVMQLRAAGCMVRPPPRFRFSPAIAARMSPSLAPFSRATLPEAGAYLFDVWRLPDVTIKGRDALTQLGRVAEETVRQHEQEGATDIELESFSLPTLDGRPTWGTVARFRAGGTVVQSSATWFADRDGAVFRISAGGPPSRSLKELVEVVAQAVSSWSRLP